LAGDPAAVSLGVLDLVLVVLAAGFAISGVRQGFVVGVLSFVGFFGGGLLGAQVAPPVARYVTEGPSAPLVGLLAVFVAACLGQLLGALLGGVLRSRLTWRPARFLDAAGGGLVSALSVLLVAWMIATPLASSSLPGLARAVRTSVVVETVDGAVPAPLRQAYDSLRELVDREDFPEVFGTLTPTRVRPVPAPDPAVLASPAVRRARPSVVKVTGLAPDCGRRLEGSGFVYAAERVMTNAHVLAGVRSPEVEVGEETLPARVVVFDPRRDLAVLAVPGLNRPSLPFAPNAAVGANAVVAGYPQDGPFAAAEARVRDRQRVRGNDIYGGPGVVREVYAVRGQVLPGNSGGPLLDAGGRVLGVVFAAAADDPDTGFALTAAEVRSGAVQGRASTDPVGTGDCD